MIIHCTKILYVSFTFDFCFIDIYLQHKRNMKLFIKLKKEWSPKFREDTPVTRLVAQDGRYKRDHRDSQYLSSHQTYIKET